MSSPNPTTITLAQQAAFFETNYLPTAQKACDFLTASTDPYHAVANAMSQLQAAGFMALNTALPFSQQQQQQQQLKPGGKYYYHVHHSALVAFCIGGSVVVPTTASTTTTTTASTTTTTSLPLPLPPFGFHIIGGHTDSPTLKLKPRSSSKNTTAAVKQLGVQCYGGGLWHTWLDRDLSLSGKVLVRRRQRQMEGAEGDEATTTTSNTSSFLEPQLIQLHQPMARVSSLAIHLQTAEERTRLLTNKETHTVPVIATHPNDIPYLSKLLLEQGLEQQINNTSSTITSTAASSTDNSNDDDDDDDPYAWTHSQEPYLLQLIATRLGLESVNDIMDWDLSFYDTQPAAVGGMCREFLQSARLDNLATVFCGLTSIIDYATATATTNSTAFHDSKDVSMVVFFDHEEVGSQSAEGAGSPIITNAIQRIAAALVGVSSPSPSATVSPDYMAACLERSFILSIDMAHAIHPNYISKHDAQHAPKLNGGMVLKTNCNQRYTTSGSSNSGFLLRELAARRGRGRGGRGGGKQQQQQHQQRIPIQEFVVQNDCACGTTIGPVLSAKTGIRTVDAGMPQWSMHSCREVMGIADLTHCLNLFQEFFTSFRELDDSLKKELSL